MSLDGLAVIVMSVYLQLAVVHLHNYSIAIHHNHLLCLIFWQHKVFAIIQEIVFATLAGLGACVMSAYQQLAVIVSCTVQFG